MRSDAKTSEGCSALENSETVKRWVRTGVKSSEVGAGAFRSTLRPFRSLCFPATTTSSTHNLFGHCPHSSYKPRRLRWLDVLNLHKAPLY